MCYLFGQVLPVWSGVRTPPVCSGGLQGVAGPVCSGGVCLFGQVFGYQLCMHNVIQARK